MMRYLPASRGKRLSETAKWEDLWFRKLSPTAKNLWQWLHDHCDYAGVINPDLQLASFQIGEAIEEEHLAELTDRTQRLPDGKIWLTDFIPCQYGQTLSVKSSAHRAIIKLIQAHGLAYPIPSVMQPTANGKRTHGVPLAKGTGYGLEYGLGRVSKERGMGKTTKSFAALRLANDILFDRAGWSYDNCKVDIKKLKSSSLSTVIEPFVDKIKPGKILAMWHRAVTTAHGAKVDGLAKDPTAYAVQCFKNQLTEACQGKVKE